MSDESKPAVTARLRDDDWETVAGDTSWLKQLAVRDRQFVQQYLSWKAFKRGSALSKTAARGVALLRLLNARDRLEHESPRPAEGPGVLIRTPDFHGYSRASLSYVEAVSESRLTLRFRPALHDAFDPWSGHRPLNTLEFLTIEASVAADPEHPAPRLESLVLFSQRSLNPSSWIADRQSWMLEVLARRGGLFDPTDFHVSARAGGGKTFQLGRRAYAYGLLTTAFVTQGSGLAFVPGIDVGVLLLPTPDARLGARWTREHDMLNWSRQHQRIEGWIRYDVTPAWGIRATAADGPLGTSFTTTLDWYPIL